MIPVGIPLRSVDPVESVSERWVDGTSGSDELGISGGSRVIDVSSDGSGIMVSSDGTTVIVVSSDGSGITESDE